MALTVLTWWWGNKYPAVYLERLAAGLRRHLRQPHRLVCMTGPGLAPTFPVETRPIADPGLCLIRGCFARLRAFDPWWQLDMDIGRGDPVVWLDLDLIITGPLDPLFDRKEDLVVLQGANASNPCPFNGSVVMFRGGAHAEVWTQFSPERAKRVPYHEFPDDQGWLWHCVPHAAGWRAGASSGIYAFHKPGWPGSDALPPGARIVAFPGSRDPSGFTKLPWVREHWCWYA